MRLYLLQAGINCLSSMGRLHRIPHGSALAETQGSSETGHTTRISPDRECKKNYNRFWCIRGDNISVSVLLSKVTFLWE